MQKTKNVNEASVNLPETKFRAGAVCATVWLNRTFKEGQEQTYKTVSLERSYKDQQGEWQTTTSLRTNDLPKAQLVLRKAYEHIVLQQGN